MGGRCLKMGTDNLQTYSRHALVQLFISQIGTDIKKKLRK